MPHVHSMPAPDPNPFVFGGPQLDRLTLHRGDAAWLKSALASPDACFVPVCDEQSVVLGNGAQASALILTADAAKPLLDAAFCVVLLGNYQGRVCFALGLSSNDGLPPEASLTNLRAQFDSLDSGTLALLGYARALVHWHRHHRFCGKCGALTHSEHAGHELHCQACGNVIYPRINPAVIVLVSHGEQCLLGNQTETTPLRYSTLAGFVEPGEDLETALRREVFEETNIRLGKVRHRYSQPWPYPASLMLGFHAEAINTDIRLNDGELRDARWFTRDEILAELTAGKLALSSRYSISYQLLREWFGAPGSGYEMQTLDTAKANRPI